MPSSLEPHGQAAGWLELGVALNAEGRSSEAAEAFSRALAIDPTLPEASLGLGLALIAQGDVAGALVALERAVMSPDPPAAWRICLAQARYLAGDFAGSDKAFARANADEALAGNALAVWRRVRLLADALAGDPLAALEQYRIEDHGTLVEHLAVAEECFLVLANLGHGEAALPLGRWRIANGPHDPALSYRVALLAGQTFTAAPADFVVTYFNAFAPNFEERLVNELGYDGPAELAALLPSGRRYRQAVDIGCGVGLARPVLAPLTDRLVGVDLARQMLARAAEKGGYDALIEAEAVAFLTSAIEVFDLVFAADVLIYIGDLEPFFTAAASALASGGLLAMTTERAHDETDGWTLRPSGRFAHGDDYVVAAAGTRFRLIARQEVALRKEGLQFIRGGLHLLERL